MKLFGFLKKKPVRQFQEVELPDDFNPLNINHVLWYIKSSIPGTSDEEAMEIFKDLMKDDKDQEHLRPDGELPKGWWHNHRDFTEQVDKDYGYYLDDWIAHRYKSPSEQIDSLQSLIYYIQHIRKVCKEKGECYDYWLNHKFCSFDDDMYNQWVDELTYLKEHYDELDAEYRKKIHIEEVIIPQLQKELPKVIKATPGILQTEVYKLYPSDYKDHVSYELYKMARDGIITREKSGRTYSLFMER